MATRATRSRQSSDTARRNESNAGRASWPEPPAGLQLTWLSLDGEWLAVLSYPLRQRAPLVGLTRTERDVVDHVIAGRSNAEIARHRGTSARTVANQVAVIFRKLGVGSRRELASVVVGSPTDAVT
jgi:DNA-binding CsgD family transcriptional regulator